MKPGDLNKALRLKNDIEAISYLIKETNEASVQDHYGISDKVLQYVDQKSAAKGLCSLLIEAKIEMEQELRELGVDVP